MIGGGKFANGAWTAAFQHLLNAEENIKRLRLQKMYVGTIKITAAELAKLAGGKFIDKLVPEQLDTAKDLVDFAQDPSSLLPVSVSENEFPYDFSSADYPGYYALFVKPIIVNEPVRINRIDGGSISIFGKTFGRQPAWQVEFKTWTNYIYANKEQLDLFNAGKMSAREIFEQNKNILPYSGRL